MIKIGLLGAPGCGKSTLAAYVYAMLKDTGIDGELVTEYIREHVNRHKKVPSITFQSVIYERQVEKEKIIPQDLDFFITDSPHILSYIFASIYINYNDIDQVELLGDLYLKFLRESRDAYDLIYVLDHNHPPKMDDGVRYQTDGEMELLKRGIPTFLDMHKVKYTTLGGDIPTKKRAKMIVADVKNYMKNNVK
jgi:nicotinamide riboside kinase